LPNVDEENPMDTLVVGSWASLHDGCEVVGDVGGRDVALLTVRGTGRQPFELLCQAEPLRQLVKAGTQALAEMDAIAVSEEAREAARQHAASGQTAGVRR